MPFTPSFSAADWCYLKPGTDAATYYARLAAAGYAFAELVPPERRAMARSAGLHILNAAGAGGLNRVENHPTALERIRHQIADLVAEGIGQLLVFSGNREGQSPQLGIANCITAIKQVAADAERANVTLALEVFNTFDHCDYDADNSEYAFAVVRSVSSPAVKVLYDLYHMHRMGEDVAAVVRANIEFIAHLHIAGSPKRDFPGAEQSLDYAAVVRKIHRAGYRGAWGMEFLPETGTDPAEELDRAIRLFRSYFV